MENLPRNPQGHPPASRMLDDLLNLLVDLDVTSSQGAAKSNPSAPITNDNSAKSDRLSPPDLNPDPNYEASDDSGNGNNSSPKISKLINAHRQSLLKSLALPIAPPHNSPPEKPSTPPKYNSSANLVTPPPNTIDSQPIAAGKSNNEKALPEVTSANSYTQSHPQTSYSELSHNAIDHSLSINNIDNSKTVLTEVSNSQVSNSNYKTNTPEVHNSQLNNLEASDSSNLEANNPEIIDSQLNNLEVSDSSNPEANNSKANNPEVKLVVIPETKVSTNSENSYSQPHDFIHPKIDHVEVNHSKFDNSTNARDNDSENSSKSSSQNDSRSSYSQALRPASNETKATVNSLGLLMDLVLNSEDTSYPVRQTVEVTAIPAPEPPEELEVDEDPLNILQRLLVNPDVYDAQKLLQNLEVSLKKLESQIYEPEKLIELLLPMIAEVLSLRISQSKEEVVEAITPIIDEVIQHRIEQDRVAMSGAIAPIISEAISRQIADSPEEIANAIGPTMGKAIQEQIRLEKDSMVDALYPIIGTTISKYMGEEIAKINRQVETAFSAEGLKRKVQAKIQGVSEAELIFREALPFRVLAAFLIHKSSGLLIADAQLPKEEHLEADMIAGMLTAIRSFANDCMTSSNKNSSELNQIDYSDSKIVLEVAGYCYLALVVKGQMTEKFVKKFRQSMSTIVRIYNKPIMNFEGDRSTIPEEVNTLVEDMITYNDPDVKPTSRYPWTLGLVVIGVFSIIAIPLGIYQYRQSINYQIAQQVITALDKTPELSVYRLEAQVVDDQVRLSGKVPNAALQNRAGAVAKQTSPKLAIDNQIIAVDISIDPSFTATEIQRTTTVLNKIPGIMISSKYEAGILEMNGMVKDRESIGNITKVMQNIPGIKILSNQIQLGNINQSSIAQRIYFDAGSANVPPSSLPQITETKNLLNLNPSFRLRITGYTDSTGSVEENQRLATARAINIQQVFLDQGIEQKQLESRGSTNKMPDAVELWQSRFVEFELIAPNIQN